MVPSMRNLDSYLISEMTEERLAELASTHQSTINRLRRRKAKADLELALRIETATAGIVRAEALPITSRCRSMLKLIRGGSFCLPVLVLPP